MALDAKALRDDFTAFFVARGHLALPPAGLIPHDPSVLFTIAGMVPFKPYFVGEQTPPAPRATTIQPCFRMVDIELVGQTARHATFFEMLGNFSFGDYFKELAIPMAYDLVTEVFGFDPGRLWVTVHESDTDASGIWQETTAIPEDRIQKMGADNFWRMGDTGPCGPCSEIYFDRGPRYGPDGGPAHGGGDRFVEIWNLVFMQYERAADGTLSELPRKNIDTGAGLERILAAANDLPSVFHTDVFAPILEEAARRTGSVPGRDPATDVALRILADHARAMTFLISDGVFPTNDGRGYVLRRVIRRAVLRAYQLGVKDPITPALSEAVVATLGDAYPKLQRDQALVSTVLAHEEEAFLRTLRSGSALIEEELAKGGDRLSGETAFLLHDTFGFPVELTSEIAAQRGVEIDRLGFEEQMAAQRARARQAGRGGARAGAGDDTWRRVLADFGPTRFLGYQQEEAQGRVVAVAERAEDSYRNIDGESPRDGATLLDVVLDATPFYAEGGGQVGDTGTISSPRGEFRVLDTTYAAERLVRHTGYLVSGTLESGEEVTARVDHERRSAIRRNHTATHLLQASLRAVLGEHVKQQGSLVAPDRLRFDFSHFGGALSPAEITAVEERVNRDVLSDQAVRVYETSRAGAEESGAIAFFGEKYGDIVRVVEAGDVSVELCGGTHVGALGQIGPFKILSEASIGANTRRIEASTGERSLALFRHEEEVLEKAAGALRTTADELPEALERLLGRTRQLEDELKALKGGGLKEEARTLGAAADGGAVVARRDGLEANELRELALLVRDQPGVEVVGLLGSPDGTKAALVVACKPGTGRDARAIASEVARLLGGGGGGSPELATAGARDAAGIDRALERLGELLRA